MEVCSYSAVKSVAVVQELRSHAETECMLCHKVGNRYQTKDFAWFRPRVTFMCETRIWDMMR